MIIVLFPLASQIIAKLIWKTKINLQEMAISTVVCTLLVIGVWHLGKYSVTQDTEIWNGVILSKDRKPSQYVHTYDCFCFDSCVGSGSDEICTKTCQTCEEDRYTVTWFAESSFGRIVFQHLDRDSRSVYNVADPASYRNCVVGEAASIEKSYTNYVQAVPQRVFGDLINVGDEFAEQIPDYPKVYDFYRLDRVIDMGADLPSYIHSDLENGLDNALITLGPSKQANIILIATDISDPGYRRAVEKAWEGGEKNDIVVFLGLRGLELVWVDVMTWAMNKGNDVFNRKLRESLASLQNIQDAKSVVSTITLNVQELYDRPEMQEFEYLKDEIQPPLWVIILAAFIAIGGSMLFTLIFHNNDVNLFSRR